MGWFVAALAVMVASQLVRLFQTEPLAWIFCDYAGRVGALLVLVAVPRARVVAFGQGQRTLAAWKLPLGIIGLAVFDRLGWYVCYRLLSNHAFGVYPAPHGWLRLVDLTLGLALVAFSEEIMFRRCARSVLQATFGDGALMVIATSVLFAGYHWTFGSSTMAAAGLFGVVAMLFYMRSNVIWPLVVAHYLADILAFY